MDLAAWIALATAVDFLRKHGRPERVRFVLFDGGAYGAFSACAGTTDVAVVLEC